MKRLLGLMLLSALVRPSYSADRWLQITTTNYDLVGNEGETEMRRIGRSLEEFRSALAVLFPRLQQRSPVDTVVLVFKNDATFKPFKPLSEGKASNVAGFFLPGPDVNYIGLTATDRIPEEMLHHYAHWLVKNDVGGLPLWLGEGLAEYYSSFDSGTRANEFSSGRILNQHLKSLQNTISLESLISTGPNSTQYNETTRQGPFYAHSWAAVHYLIQGDGGKRRPQLARFLSLLSENKSPDESFSEAFGVDRRTIDKELNAYARARNTWTLMRSPPREGAAIDSAWKVTELTEIQAEYYFGDLLLHMGRQEEAASHLQRALSGDSRLIAAQSSLGTLRSRERKYDEAHALLQKAADADSRGYRTHYAYASFLKLTDDLGVGDSSMDSTDRAELARKHLKRAIELAPTFVEAYALLAQVDLSGADHLDEAEQILEKALSLTPGRHDIALLLGETFLRTDRVSAARNLFASLAHVSSDSRVRSQARSITEQIDARRSQFEELPVRKDAVAEPAPRPPRDSSSTVVRRNPGLQALTPITPVVEGQKVSGLLLLMDCTNGVMFRVQSDRGLVNFHSSKPEQIQFLSYTSEVSDNIRCGPRDPGVPVTITYRESPGGAFAGEPLVVEFVEK